MPGKKVKFTKGELKRQRDAQERYERYLPTLQLKQQQLQLEVRQTESLLYRRRAEIGRIKEDMSAWIGILGDPGVDLVPWVRPKRITTSTANIAGVTIPTLKNVAFPAVDYDLFTTPLWVDSAVREIRNLVGLIAEADIIQEQFKLLSRELQITMQRVNLFEKVKIPECKENIRAIRIYLGDQDTNAVCRSKIAKRKIEQAVVAA
ncbi:MAG: V-type ATP synthase subunit D [Candidatus Euphemobacter frigidus]|nr:V-type ATP synthase subunit D [Candidatus Euphemobacter frigidus]MDP8276247.1 V-type ATP synthase subunit D [Candidatus Euphemobacter frigidus]